MNAERRKAITAVQEAIGNAQAEAESLRDEEQEAFDNLPELFQQGDKGETMQNAIDALEQAISSLEEAVSSLNEAAEG